MKNLIFSISVGGIIGMLCGLIFIYGNSYFASRVEYALLSALSKPVEAVKYFNSKEIKDINHYFISPKEYSVQSENKVVFADFETMNLELFDKGEKVGEYKIQSIGKEGTAWQTPIGEFDMNYKEKNHFSSLGHVYMPWSIQFFGNYFIHGWPYYPDGTPVARGYSGGCIRMETEDAEKIYAFTDADTQLITSDSSSNVFSQENFKYQVETKSPKINAQYIIADVQTGEVVAGNNQKEKKEVKTFSHIMTALISLESLNQYTNTSFDSHYVTISDVLYPLLLSDNPNAERILLDHSNENQFIKNMNTRSRSIGMNDTEYIKENAGTSISTLEDTFKLVQYLNTYKPFLISVLKLSEYKKDEFQVENLFPFKKENGYLGGLTDEENSEMLSFVTLNSFEKSLNEKNEFVIIVSNSSDAKKDMELLKLWLDENVSLK